MSNRHKNKKYFNIENILDKKDTCYDVIIGEHSKGKKYALRKREEYLLGRCCYEK